MLSDVLATCTPVGGGLDKIVVLMEGESLFNDATSIVLFEIFFEMVKKLGDGGSGTEGGLLKEGLNIVVQIGWLAAGMLCMLCMLCGCNLYQSFDWLLELALVCAFQLRTA